MPVASIGRWRMLRAAIFATVSLSLAAGAHVAGGGRVPDTFACLVGLTIAATVSVLLSRRSRGSTALLVVLALLQAALHEVMSLSEAATCGPHGVTMGGMLPASTATVSDSAMCAGMSGSHGSLLMVLTHVAAMLATVVVLARGERLVVVIWQLLMPRAAFALPHIRAWRGARLLVTRPLLPWAPRACTDVQRRGPPLVRAAY